MKLTNKPIPGYEDNYYLDPISMEVMNKKRNRPLKPFKNRRGYPEVGLWKNNKRSHKSLHRLFAEAYIENPDNLPYINHKDENPENYNLDNLEWCTQSYNQRYGTVNERRGPKISKANAGRSKPWVAEQKAKPVIATDRWGNETRYPSGREAARQIGIQQSGVSYVLAGQRNTAGGYRFRYATDDN